MNMRMEIITTIFIRIILFNIGSKEQTEFAP